MIMESRLVFVTGGCRSGKSAYALRLAEKNEGTRCFVATCPVLDAEMADRVRRHREERRGNGWRTIEEEVDVAGAIASCPEAAVVLVDCLTLWVNNLMYRAELDGRLLGEDDAFRAAGEFCAAAHERPGMVIAVANEVGMGIVPENAAARRFRDLAGRVNQTVAACADEVFFLVAGLPMKVK